MIDSLVALPGVRVLCDRRELSPQGSS